MIARVVCPYVSVLCKVPSTYSQVPRLTSTGRLGGEEVEESQDLDVKVGILGQNQNNALRKHILLMLITEHEE